MISKSIVWRVTVLGISLLALPLASASACESFIDPKGRSVVDFAPLPGFADDCWQSPVCEMFLPLKDSPYYPVGLFFDPSESAAYRTEALKKGSMKQLTAQLLGSAKNGSMDDFKDFVRKMIKESIPDESIGRGTTKKTYKDIVSESNDLISWGFTHTSFGEDSRLFEIRTGIGTYLKVKGETVSLFVTEYWRPPFEGGREPDGESTKALSKRWIDCIRDKNK